MSRQRRVAGFLEIARRELDAAKRLCAPLPGEAAFFVAQAAEKLVKAVLVREDITFPASHHQLERLVSLLPPGHAWHDDLIVFDTLSPYATRYRYPLPDGRLPPLPDRNDLARHIAAIEALIPEIEDWCREE